MDKDLEKLVEERKKQAEDRQIFCRAFLVTNYLGKNQEFSKDGLEIKELNDSKDVTTRQIIYNNEIVFSFSTNWGRFYDKERGRIDSYIPGAWEQKLDQYYQQAVECQKVCEEKLFAKEKAEELRREKELKRKWGL